MPKIYHTSPNKITKIEKRELFGDCLFFSNEPYSMSIGDVITYAMDIENMDFVDPSHFFYDDDYYKLDNIVSEIMNYADIDEEIAQNLLDGSVGEYEVLEGESAAELGWWIQGKQGEAAKTLGYDGTSSIDEQGTVYIIPMLNREFELVEE